MARLITFNSQCSEPDLGTKKNELIWVAIAVTAKAEMGKPMITSIRNVLLKTDITTDSYVCDIDHHSKEPEP